MRRRCKCGARRKPWRVGQRFYCLTCGRRVAMKRCLSWRQWAAGWGFVGTARRRA